MLLTHAKQDVEYAFRILELSIRVMCYLELGKVDMKSFGRDVTIGLGKDNFSLDDQYFLSHHNAVLVSQMNVGVSFGTSAIALGNFFESARIQKNPDSNEPVDTLWSLVYAVRNAFAHGIANPKWIVNKKYERMLNIDLENGKLIVDLARLNGCEFE